jgi:transcriptional regulator with GAF, ATPase, and Fis domain
MLSWNVMAERHPRTTASMQRYGAHASPEATRATRAGLVLLYAPHFDQFSPTYLLSERDLVIGRDPTCGVCVPEGAVSRQHARVSFRGTRWVVTDLGSRNGTLIDGRFITELALQDQHELRVGDAIFKFVAQGAESFAAYRIDGASAAPAGAPSLAGIVGNYQIRMLLKALHRVAPSEISVVVLGESGTGKELFARELHLASGRKGSFQAVNCAAIPGSLLESELFGYKRGAFSGADRDKIGIIKAADHGTLFLDEIGDMPIEAQAKLLRVLQSREIIPIGATTPERVDVRIVCATHRNLAALQRDEKFRGDLFARLNEYSVTLPPLRDRKEDVFALVRSMLFRQARQNMIVSFPFMTGLLHYDWPFNVRELEAAIKRAVAVAEGDVLEASHLPDAIKEVMLEYGIHRVDTDGSLLLGPAAQAAAVNVTQPPIDVRVQPPPDDLPPSRSASEVQGELARSWAAVPPRHQTAPPPAYGHEPGGRTTPHGAHAPPPARIPGRFQAPTEEELRALMTLHRGNVAAVGREFGKERMQVHRWLRKYGIDAESYR